MSTTTQSLGENLEVSSVAVTRADQTNLNKKECISNHAAAALMPNILVRLGSILKQEWANMPQTWHQPNQMKRSREFQNTHVTAPLAPLIGKSQKSSPRSTTRIKEHSRGTYLFVKASKFVDWKHWWAKDWMTLNSVSDPMLGIPSYPKLRTRDSIVWQRGPESCLSLFFPFSWLTFESIDLSSFWSLLTFALPINTLSLSLFSYMSMKYD